VETSRKISLSIGKYGTLALTVEGIMLTETRVGGGLKTEDLRDFCRELNPIGRFGDTLETISIGL
jgi:hypothetical protein